MDPRPVVDLDPGSLVAGRAPCYDGANKRAKPAGQPERPQEATWQTTDRLRPAAPFGS